MKKFYLLSSLLLLVNICFTQELVPIGGEFVFEKTQCITDSERHHIEATLQENTQRLKYEGKLTVDKNAIVFFDWPLQKTADLGFNSYYAISNYVDQDASGGLRDYDCGMRTYDGHNGIDIYTWPFDWYMYENDLVEVIAAASGTIIGKNDGEFDQYCVWGNNGTANYVIIQHSDGSVAYYWHMKNGSVTTKAVGASVVMGEYLGVVASSGFSSGPHLHFEVRDANENVIEPFQGQCNNLNNQSWWLAQEPYRKPTLNAILTHNSAPIMGCPAANESPHFSNCFSPGDTLYTALYFRDQLYGEITNLRLRRPDNSLYHSWIFNSVNTYDSSYWYWYWFSPPGGPYGLWKFEADYNGQTFVHEFAYLNGSASPNIWAGPSSGNWHQSSSYWSLGHIPTACDHVIIPTGYDVRVQSGNTARCYALEVQANADFKVMPGAELNVIVGDD